MHSDHERCRSYKTDHETSHDTTARNMQNFSSIRPLFGKIKMAKVHQKHSNYVMLTNKGWPSKKISFWLKYLAHYIFGTM